MSSRAKIALAVVVLVVIAGIATAIALRVAGPGPKVDVAVVEKEDLAVTVTASGKVDAGVSADVYPPTVGTLASVQIEDGQEVSAGAVLARMDTEPLEAGVLQARSALAQAEAQLSLVDSKEPAAADITAARASTDAAWAQYESALAALDAAGGANPSAADIAAAEAATDAAYAAYLSAKAQYDAAKALYDASAAPTPSTQTAKTAAEVNMKQAKASYLSAKAAEEALRSYEDSSQVAQLEAAVDQAYAAYLGALAQQRTLERASGSAERNAAQLAIEQAREGLATAEENLRKAVLRAPIDGTVVFNAVGTPGADGTVPKAAPGAPVAPQSAPFTVVDLTGVRFTAEVDEVDVGRIDVGYAAKVELDAFAGESFDATVTTIMPRATLTSTGGTVFPVYLAFSGDIARVLVGMQGDAGIELSAVPAAVTIPVEALFDEGGTAYVYVVDDDDTLSRTRVELGTLTETRAQVTTGIEPGDVVALSGAVELTDGMKIKRAE